MMRSEPFDDDSGTELFVRRLKEILAEHKDLAHELAGTAGMADQLTPRMVAVRAMSLPERCAVYGAERVDEQRQWYFDKSKFNKKRSRMWFFLLVALHGLAILTVLVRIAQPHWVLLPTEVLLVAAASALGWTQGKRYRELAAAYGLTAQEIGIARVHLARASSEEAISAQVAEMENAFSREHTQWVARRDY